MLPPARTGAYYGGHGRTLGSLQLASEGRPSSCDGDIGSSASWIADVTHWGSEVLSAFFQFCFRIVF